MAKITLERSESDDFTITRKKYGRGFQYFELLNKKITCKKQLQRFRMLAVPPMWESVKICHKLNGHIQATGLDAKARKQYIYHDLWHQQQQQAKFTRLIQFVKKLPEVRKKCIEDLASPQWQKEKLLALMVLIMDETGMRVGNQRYTEQNATYGLTTLRAKHVKQASDALHLSYKGKSGKQRQVEIDDEQLAALIKQCCDLPGYEIFKYQDEDGSWNDIDSEDLNDYVQSILGEDFSCKDFRTWVGTRLAYELYPQSLATKSQHPRRKLESILVESVAKELGNTPSICRKYHIHPKLLKLLCDSKIDPDAIQPESNDPLSDPSLSRAEEAILDILK